MGFATSGINLGNQRRQLLHPNSITRWNRPQQPHPPLLTTMSASIASSAVYFVASTKSNQPFAANRNVGTTAEDVEIQRQQKPESHNKNQWLLDLHDSQAVFDFCGGLYFQLVLSQKLRDYLARTDDDNEDDTTTSVTIFQSTVPHYHRRMKDLVKPGYDQTNHADNRRIFHGREIRQVPNAHGGMGLVLQLSYSSEDDDDDDDPEGWTAAEKEQYDGWKHDANRDWRTGDRLEREGFTTFSSQFGSNAFTLHHRFFFYRDSNQRLWLAAEDGCEGTPIIPV